MRVVVRFATSFLSSAIGGNAKAGQEFLEQKYSRSLKDTTKLAKKSSSTKCMLKASRKALEPLSLMKMQNSW